jgi:GNAT superfamily N-acetyltransferase
MKRPATPDRTARPGTRFRRVSWSTDLETVRALLQDYRNWIAEHRDRRASSAARVRRGLDQLDRLVSDLPGAYGPPRGDVLLAYSGGELAACFALREMEPKVGEIKRVYVRADHRGPEFGPRLTRVALTRARTLGYDRVRVDTLPTMIGAIQFYSEMGFRPTTAYWPHPVADAVFFEYRLPKPKRATKRSPSSKRTRSSSDR